MVSAREGRLFTLGVIFKGSCYIYTFVLGALNLRTSYVRCLNVATRVLRVF